MPASEELRNFIRSHFRSVWSLELLLHLLSNRERAWSETELVDALRASQAVVATSVESLLAGGLILLEDEGKVRYGPAGADLQRLVNETALLYASKPDAVRRLIVLSRDSAVSAFADAFKLWRD